MIKDFFRKLVRCYRAARHEWRFGGPENYKDKNDQQPFRITTLPVLGERSMRYGGMSSPYYGEQIPNGIKTPFVLKYHAVDKYGRVRYFDNKIEDGYLDVLGHHGCHGSELLQHFYGKKKPKWTYAGFLAEEE